jgi:hypothetical protein
MLGRLVSKHARSIGRIWSCMDLSCCMESLCAMAVPHLGDSPKQFLHHNPCGCEKSMCFFGGAHVSGLLLQAILYDCSCARSAQ